MTTCARNLPQHFNGCTCTTNVPVLAESDLDLGLPGDTALCMFCDQPAPAAQIAEHRLCETCLGDAAEEDDDMAAAWRRSADYKES